MKYQKSSQEKFTANFLSQNELGIGFVIIIFQDILDSPNLGLI